MRQPSGLSRGDHTALVSSESSSAWARGDGEGLQGSQGTGRIRVCAAYRISHPSGPRRRVLTCQHRGVSERGWGGQAVGWEPCRVPPAGLGCEVPCRDPPAVRAVPQPQAEGVVPPAHEHHAGVLRRPESLWVEGR